MSYHRSHRLFFWRLLATCQNLNHRPLEEVGRLLGETIHMILPPFQRYGEMNASDGEKVGRTKMCPGEREPITKKPH
jgi:hypothetical protein